MLRTSAVLIVLIFISLFFSDSSYLADSSHYLHPDSVWSDWKSESLFRLKKQKLPGKFFYYQHEKHFNGVVLVAEKGKVLHQGAYGYANLRSQDTLSMNSAFQLASVSKVFTATAVLLLYQDGKIDLDEEVRTYLKGFPYKKMTVRHLLSHRSGMCRYMAVAAKRWKKWKEPMYNSNVVYQYKRYKPITFFKPGRRFNYNNTNYVVLASLVEEISGKKFADFMEERIFEPLEMENALIYSRKDDPEIPNEVTGHKGWGRRHWKAANDYIDGVVGDKGMYASALDLYKFDQALYSGKLLKPEIVEEALSPESELWRRNNYGLGWRLKKQDNSYLSYHFGWWRGFRTCFIRDVDKERTVIILSNTDVPGRNLKFWDIYSYLSDQESW